MKLYWMPLIILLFGQGCNNPFTSDCRITVPLSVSDISLPDTASYNELVKIGIEVTYPSCGYSYTGPVVISSENGCDIWLFGERETCQALCQMVIVDNYSINIIADRRGEYIVRAMKGQRITSSDTMFVK